MYHVKETLDLSMHFSTNNFLAKHCSGKNIYIKIYKVNYKNAGSSILTLGAMTTACLLLSLHRSCPIDPSLLFWQKIDVQLGSFTLIIPEWKINYV